MQMKKQIQLSNGNVVNINPNLNAFVLFQLEKEGVITNSFMSSLFTAGNAQSIDLLDAIRTVYAAYRQATPTGYMSFDEFTRVYEVDMSEAIEVYAAIVKKDRKNNMAGGFNRKTPKKGLSLPDFKIESVIDLYSLYVFIFEIPAADFWNLPLSDVQRIAENKSAYEGWKTYMQEKEAK